VSAVSKISGDPPDVKLAGSELPPVMDARLCIDDEGRVTAARVLTSVDARAETEIATALQSWRYAPYQADGTAQAVCFDVTFWAR
jgi:hypothetical protein